MSDDEFDLLRSRVLFYDAGTIRRKTQEEVKQWEKEHPELQRKLQGDADE